MDVDEQALHQFIADQTDFPLDRVATVLRLGTPWPELMAIAARLSQIHHDADAAKAKLHTVAAAHVDMLEMDVDDPVDVQEIADHIVGTATRAHEQLDMVAAVRSAMLAYYRQRFKETEEQCKALLKMMADEGRTR